MLLTIVSNISYRKETDLVNLNDRSTCLLDNVIVIQYEVQNATDKKK